MALMTSRHDVANDLLQFGEDATALWVESCSEEEFVRVSNAAEFVWYRGPGARSGASMILAKAIAIGAVYVHEGAPRKLARGRRDLTRQLPTRPAETSRNTDYWLQHSFDAFHGVGDDFVEFWAVSPVDAREFLRRARANPQFKRDGLRPRPVASD